MATVLAFFPNKAVLVQAQQSVLIPNQGSAGCSISSISLARLSTTVLPSQAKQCKLMQNSAGFHPRQGSADVAVQAQAQQCWLSFQA